MNLMPTCQDVTLLLPDLEDNSLSTSVRLRLKFHLGLCKACRAMRDSLQRLPGILRNSISQETDSTPSAEAQQALAAALVRLQAGGRVATGSLIDRGPAHPICSFVQEDVQSGKADLPLRLMAETYTAIQAQGGALSKEPYLPESVLRALPPPSSWKWTKALMNGCSSAFLAHDPETGASLHLILLPPGRRFPNHRHRGDEHVLLLAGHAEDSQFYGVAGDWFHQESGTEHRHLQGRGDDVCWTLSRLEGHGVKLGGWRGVVQAIAERVA